LPKPPNELRFHSAEFLWQAFVVAAGRAERIIFMENNQQTGQQKQKKDAEIIKWF